MRKKNFLRFVTQKPLYKLKELLVTSPTLLRGLHTMSMTKTAPDGLKTRECKQIKLREPPPVPYVPVKDKVQEEVARMRNMEIKRTIEKDTMLNFPVWQENGTRKGFLMHVTAVLNAIKKRGHLWTTTRPCLSTRKPAKPSRQPGLVYLYWRSLKKKQTR